MSEPIAPYHERLPELETRAQRARQPRHAGARRLGRSARSRTSTARERLRGGPAARLQDPRRAARQGLPGGRHPVPRPAARAALPVLPRAQAPPQRPVLRRPTCGRRAAACSARSLPNLARRRLPVHQDAPAPRRGLRRSRSTTRCCTPSGMVERALTEALDPGRHTSARADELQVLERLQDILLRERVVTAYQPILRHAGRHGHGLRGPLARAARLGPRVRRRALRRRQDHNLLDRAGPAVPPARAPAPRAASPPTRRSS